MSAFKEARYHTLQMMEIVDRGYIDKDQLIQNLLAYLSDYEVADFMRQYEYDDIAEEL